jgi:hypothetical protein
MNYKKWFKKVEEAYATNRFDQTFDPVMRQLEKLISSFLGLPVRRSLSSVAKRSKKA